MKAIRTIALSATLTALAVAPLAAQNTPAQESGDESRGWLRRLWNRIPHQERDLDWLTGDFNVWSGAASLAVLAASHDAAASSEPGRGLAPPGGSRSDVTRFGDDIYQWIPGAGYATSLAARDYRGTILMGAHNFVSSTVMQELKDGVGQRRPDDSNDRSFPSGHTNTAFLGAAFLQQRYGPRWGGPAYLAAVAVAWSRVYSNVHYVNDTVAGASIAMMSAWAIVPPYESARRERWADQERFRRMSYELEMTFNDVERNRVHAPPPGGDAFAWPTDATVDEPWASSHVAFEYRLDRRRSVVARFSPWEIRSRGELANPVRFAGETLPAETPLRGTHRLFHYGAQYRHTWIEDERLRLRVGAGLAAIHAKQELFVVDETVADGRGLTSQARSDSLYAAIHADADVALFRQLRLSAEADYGTNGDCSYRDASLRLGLRLDSRWSVSAGVREYTSEIEDGGLANDFRRRGPAVNLLYSF